MKLEEYIKKEKEHLDKFEKYVKEMNEVDPTLYPLDMEPDEWDEQFIIITGATSFSPEGT